MHTIQQIINNQQIYRENIISWFKEELRSAKKNLRNIKSENKYILKQKKKLENRFKKIQVDKHLNKFFFLCPQRNKQFYFWWDEENKEVIVLEYGEN